MNINKGKIGQAKSIFQKHGGILRASDAFKEGIHPRTLYFMRDNNELEVLCRGTYRLAELEPIDQQDIVTVASKVKPGVICLISALSFHEITTQIPHEVCVAISRTMAYPRLKYPPTRFFRFSDDAFQAGIEVHKISGIGVKIYSPEKTIVDCFKYRNKIGLDVAIEALKFWRKKKNARIDKLVEYAKICRVYNVIKPYAEAML
ncbi:MAG: transcriptional regulator [Planctomycetes bacterium GWC2_45_44]|nr:MAG: transcriptional regulator [Planctomycetes bacterium GWC2_45_44]HBR19398.1 transcriptional regulator [Phycisphaerales bacterium]